jgi:divalent metal cation (Fe/Co/Zn/Cd) transporter
MNIANPYLHGNLDDKKALNLKRWASVASLGVAIILVAVKFVAFLRTDSVSIQTSLMDSRPSSR